MGSSKSRRRFSAEEKLAILKRHLVNKESVADVCEEIGLHPNQFYRWQSELFSDGAAVFDRSKTGKKVDRERQRLEDRNSQMEKLLQSKDGVIAEITEDYVRLKKKHSATCMESGSSPMFGIG